MLQHTGETATCSDNKELEFCFTQRNLGSNISPTWILLDSKSTVSICKNKSLLKSVLWGSKRTTPLRKERRLPGYPSNWQPSRFWYSVVQPQVTSYHPFLGCSSKNLQSHNGNKLGSSAHCTQTQWGERSSHSPKAKMVYITTMQLRLGQCCQTTLLWSW